MIFKVYICQGPEKHMANFVARGERSERELCACCLSWPVDEVEVVRVEELLQIYENEGISALIEEISK